MAEEQKKKTSPVRHGIPSSEQGLKESAKTFKDIEDCIAFIDKQQSSLLTKKKSSAIIKKTKPKTGKKEESECRENRTSTRKKPSKK